MSLLDLARGPVLQAAMGIFVFGVTWRLVMLALFPRKRDLTPAREGALPAPLASGREFFRRLWPDLKPTGSNAFTTINGYVFHFGLAIIVFGFLPHILFFKSLLGIKWPHLPTPIIYIVAGITIASLLAALFKRLSSPVQRAISNADDYFSWLVTFAPVVTGVAATGHLLEPYSIVLAVHILSVALLLAWLPFGKLFHAFMVFVSRGRTGAHLNHRGAQL